ncbi:MAG: hypothetical protein Kow0068_10410 [Marinilabiliales bacterium]
MNSTPGEGSTFYLSITIFKPINNIEKEYCILPETLKSFENKKVLVADINKELYLLQKFLKFNRADVVYLNDISNDVLNGLNTFDLIIIYKNNSTVNNVSQFLLKFVDKLKNTKIVITGHEKLKFINSGIPSHNLIILDYNSLNPEKLESLLNEHQKV